MLANGSAGVVVDKSSSVGTLVAKRRYLEMIVAEGGDVDITKQDILVSIGRGIQKQENVAIAQELADALGAAVSCSRPVVDAKWMEKSRQVGSSGKTVKPKVYGVRYQWVIPTSCWSQGQSTSDCYQQECQGPHFPSGRFRDRCRHFGVSAGADQPSSRSAQRQGCSRSCRPVKERLAVIDKKTLKLSVKSLKDFAKRRLPDEATGTGRKRRMPARHRAFHVRSGSAGHSTFIRAN